MLCPLCEPKHKLVRLSDENVYRCKYTGLYFRSRRGKPSPPTGMTEPPEKAVSGFDIFLEEQGIDAVTYKQLDKETQKGLRLSYLNWLKERGHGEKETIERKFGVKFSPEGFEAWKKRRQEIYETLQRARKA